MSIHIQCTYCNEVLDDFEAGPYCPECRTVVRRRAIMRIRQAKVSNWAKKCGPKGAHTAQLSSALVFELGGYEEAAKEIVTAFRKITQDPRRPKQATHMLLVILRLIIEGLPAEKRRLRWVDKKPTKEQKQRHYQSKKLKKILGLT